MLKVIKTKKDFDEALERFNEVFNAPIGTPESDEADLLADLIEAYDDEHYSIEIPERFGAGRIRAEKG